MKIAARDRQESRAPLLKAVAPRVVLAALFWLVLTEGDTGYWGLALLIIGLTALVSLVFVPVASWRWRLMGLLRFLPYFMKQSLHGGINVSRRAFHPRMPLNPGYVEYQIRLPEGPWRVFYVNAINLMPGTVVVRVEGDSLQVHALDESMAIEESLGLLEERVADLFGVELVS